MKALGRIWAIATMTLLEARRRKVFTILLLFGVALLSSVLFFPSVQQEDSRLRLIEIWSLRASALFTAIVGLFLAGFSLPTDFEQKRIYMIVTKPVSKPFVFLGRYLGYVMLLAVFVASMGVITVVFLRTVKLFSGDKFQLVAYPRVQADLFEFPGGDAVSLMQTEVGGLVKFGPERALVWGYEGLRRSNFGDMARAQARLIFGAVENPYRASGTVDIRVRNPQGRSHQQKLPMNTNEERTFEFPADLIGPDGVIVIEFRCADSDGLIAATPHWLRLYEKSMPFELAFARGLVLILLQSMVVLSITLMASTFLSAPLSIILGIMLYIVGSIYGYIRDGTREIDQSLSELKPGEVRHRHPDDLPVGLLWFSNRLSKIVLKVVPDFAHFDYSLWLLKDHAVSWRELALAGGKALPPILVLVLLGTLRMRFKDFDR